MKKALAVIWLLGAAQAEAPRAEVRHDESLCLAYQAALDGDYLVVRAAIEPGWHTFAMDNELRAKEKLAGKQSLGIDRQTDIAVTGSLAVAGPWYQTPPRDFSKPELRWFSWGFEREAAFVAKIRRGSGTQSKIHIRGQACTDTTCKNIDVEMVLGNARAQARSADILKDLVPVR